MFSPVPTQIVFGLLGSSVRQPIEYESSSSKIVSQVVPRFSVFQTPPLPTATYQILWFSGWITMSEMRPDMNAGPMLRNSSPANVASLNPGSEDSSSCANAEYETNAVRMTARANRYMVPP